MNGAELAICGSNLCGDVPFSVAVRTVDGRTFAQRTTPVFTKESGSMPQARRKL